MELSVGAAVCNLPIISRFVVHRWLRRWWIKSKQTTKETVNQVQAVVERVLTRNGSQEERTPQNDTLPICLAKTMSQNTEMTMKGNEVMSEICAEAARPVTR